MWNEYAVILPTTQQYHWELIPFFELFNTYWNSRKTVYVVSEQDPELHYANAEFMKIDKRYLIDRLWKQHMFSGGLRWALKKLDDPFVVILLTDYWLIDSIRWDPLRAILSYMQEDNNILRVSLCRFAEQQFLTSFAHQDRRRWFIMEGGHHGMLFFKCGETNQECFLLMSLFPAIWNREHLIEILDDTLWDPWATEVEGHHRLLDEFKDWKSLIALPAVMNWMPAAATTGGEVDLTRLPPGIGETVRPFIPAGFKVRDRIEYKQPGWYARQGGQIIDAATMPLDADWRAMIKTELEGEYGRLVVSHAS